MNSNGDRKNRTLCRKCLEISLAFSVAAPPVTRFTSPKNCDSAPTSQLAPFIRAKKGDRPSRYIESKPRVLCSSLTASIHLVIQTEWPAPSNTWITKQRRSFRRILSVLSQSRSLLTKGRVACGFQPHSMIPMKRGNYLQTTTFVCPPLWIKMTCRVYTCPQSFMAIKITERILMMLRLIRRAKLVSILAASEPVKRTGLWRAFSLLPLEMMAPTKTKTSLYRSSKKKIWADSLVYNRVQLQLCTRQMKLHLL